MIFDIRPLATKWFAEATPVNYKANAVATIGSGENGTITIKRNTMTTTDKVNIVVSTEANAALAVAYLNNKLTITLGTNAETAADDTKNTATLIAAKITEVEGFTATASGTGAVAISTATAEDVSFTNGAYGTPCQEVGIGFVSGVTYYVCVAADNTAYNDNWRTFTLSDY